jgi:hypothetical protein
LFFFGIQRFDLNPANDEFKKIRFVSRSNKLYASHIVPLLYFWQTTTSPGNYANLVGRVTNRDGNNYLHAYSCRYALPYHLSVIRKRPVLSRK